MRKPDTIEHLYLDFDGFFASVEQQLNPRLRGRPIGIVPYEGVRGDALSARQRRELLDLVALGTLADGEPKLRIFTVPE